MQKLCYLGRESLYQFSFHLIIDLHDILAIIRPAHSPVLQVAKTKPEIFMEIFHWRPAKFLFIMLFIASNQTDTGDDK